MKRNIKQLFTILWMFIAIGSPSFAQIAFAPALVPTVIGQSTVPLIFGSSATMGNNCAISAMTALPFTYANAYIYLPANAIATGSTAGWYYFVGSSTTAGTCYNNVYTSGTPTIPASPTAFATTGPGAYTQTTASNIQAFNFTIPGGTLGPYDGLWIKALATYNNTAGTKTIISFYGGYNIGSYGATTTTNVGIDTGMVNAGATNVQRMTANATGFTGSGAQSSTLGSVDSTASQTFKNTLALTVATDFVILDNVRVMYVPSKP